jgi:hypothetical protein
LAQIITSIEFADHRRRKAVSKQVYHGAALVATGLAAFLLAGVWFWSVSATGAWMMAAWFDGKARRS